MKKVLFSFITMLVSISLFSAVSAVEISTAEISAGTYLIGTHLFDRNTNENYNGTLTVKHIMLAAKTIAGDTVNDMNVYYKRAKDGAWVDAINSQVVTISDKVDIKFYNTIKIEELNTTLKAALEKQLKDSGWSKDKDITSDEFENIIKGTPNVTEVTKLAADAWKVIQGISEVIIYQSGDIYEDDLDIWDGKSSSVPELKDGNWYISKASELKFFSDFVNNGKLTTEQTKMVEQAQYSKDDYVIKETTKVYLTSNIDLGARQEDGELLSGSEWIPIGTTNNKFLGIFEGNNKTITGLYINEASRYNGIFGYANEIKNLKVKDGFVEVDGDCVGAIAGRAALIENCHNENTYIYMLSDNKYAGGVVGRIDGFLKNSTNSGTILSEGNYVGGIVGNAYGDSEVVNCINNGNVTGLNTGAAGISGINSDYVKITKCTNNGKIKGSTSASGIVGVTFGAGDISYCINTGDVECMNSVAAGIVGHGDTDENFESEENGLHISYCYNTGDITGDKAAAGIVGMLEQYASLVDRCYNTGKVEGAEQNGGIAAGISNSSKITTCYNAGEIIATSKAGGIVGQVFKTEKNDVKIINTYNIGEVSGIDYIGGIAGYNELTSITKNTYYLKNTAAKDYGNKTAKNYYKTEEYLKTTFINNANVDDLILWEIRQGVNNGLPVIVGLD